MRRRFPFSVRCGVPVILCCALAAAFVEQHAVGWNELSHFVQIRAFAAGTPRIDHWHHLTGDRAYFHGHWYGDKAPGLAFFLLPIFKLMQLTHVVKPSGYGGLHVLVLFGSTAPFLVILLLVRRLVERLDPGYGIPVVVTLALGTILLPFATMLFSHVFSACLGFCAYMLVDRERRCRAGDATGFGSLAIAGLLCGYALSTEYPLVLLVLVLAGMVLWRPRPAAAALTFGAGVAIGLIPLLGYNWWAFGDPLHLSYQSVAANSSGVLGMTGPTLSKAVRLLFANRGLLVITPVVGAAVAGIVVLWREGRRADAAVPAIVCASYYAFDLSYYLPFGGSVPGPRLMLAMLPFLAVPLAAAYRRAPLATASLALISIATMVAATITLPILSLTSPNRTWWHMFARGTFTTRGVTAALFFLFVAAACALGAWSLRRIRPTARDLAMTAVAVGGWFVVEQTGPLLLAPGIQTAKGTIVVGLIALAVVVIAILASVAGGTKLAVLAGLPLVALTTHQFAHASQILAAAGVSLLLLGALAWSQQSRLAT
jgi:hypothetical protein